MSCVGEGYPHSAHGTTVAWGGENIGMLRSFTVRAGRAQLVDVTPSNAVVVGSGWTSRCIRQVGVGSIEPATASMQIYSGTYGWSQLDRGDIRYLEIQGPWGNWQGQAILSEMSLGGSVGEFVTINLDFQFTGG